ncbi:MAG: carboxypeptidase regulatory-like domain-containing protein [Deltaproteobacteria bacterium]|nr:carboxypeptidase regulatory-like domain-containing protein [Deltaproteobacteria bacterium]
MRLSPIALAVLSAALAGLAPKAVALAAPTLTVQGRATLRITQARHAAGVVELTGELRDADLHHGLAARPVRVELAGGTRRVAQVAVTDPYGLFRVRFGAPSGVYQVSARAGADAHFSAAELSPSPLDVTRSALDLELRVAHELDASQASQLVEVRARVAARPAAVPIRLLVGGKPAADLRTDATGLARARLATAQLGAPGPLTLSARFSGDGSTNAAEAKVEVVLVSPVTVTLRADRHELQADEELELVGEVRDLLGPVATTAVGLEAMGRHVTSALTEADGRFALRLSASAFAPGPLDLVATATPAVVWRRAGSSRPLTIHIAAPRPIPVTLYAGPALVTALVLLGVAYRRRGALWRRSPRRRPSAGVTPQTLSTDAAPLPSGLRVAPPGRRTSAALDHGLAGVVWDPVDRRPIIAAEVRVTLQDGSEIHALTDGEGAFALEELAPGRHRVCVSRRGYVSERFEAALPHGGPLRGVRVDLVPVRVRLLELYRDVTLERLPHDGVWGRWTPREILRHSLGGAARDAHPLEELTALLEQAYWSAYPAAESELARARRLAARLAG